MKHIFDNLPKPREISEKTGIPYQTIVSWNARKSIRPKYWLMLIDLSGGKLTLEDFADANKGCDRVEAHIR